MTRTFRTSLTLGFVLALSASAPKAAEAQVCYIFPVHLHMGQPGVRSDHGVELPGYPGSMVLGVRQLFRGIGEQHLREGIGRRSVGWALSRYDSTVPQRLLRPNWEHVARVRC